MKRFRHDDESVVIVVGSGAGGGTLANELAQRGVNVVCLEAGSRVEAEDFRNDVPYMFKKLTWLDPREGSGDLDSHFPAYICKTVGGTTTHWTALALRVAEHEMRARSTYGTIAGASLIDWPFGHKELSHYYDRAETKMGVSGANGMPYHPGNNNFYVLGAGARKIGWKNIRTANLAINASPYDGRPPCIQLGYCKSGCVIKAKWSTLYTEIPKAEATGNFELRPQSMVLRIEHLRSGRVTAVEYADSSGGVQRQKASMVAVAGNAIETARLLLNSESSKYPDGLGNQNGNVGRHYMKHVFARFAAHMPGKVHMHRGIQQAGSLPHEAHHDPARGFVSGYHIETAPITPDHLARGLRVNGWGKEYAHLLEQYDRFAGSIITGEDLPRRSNRVTLSDNTKDRYGLPVAHVHYVYDSNARAMLEHATNRVGEIYSSVGASGVYETPLSSATHNLGTCRMASAEEEGVCNKYGRVFGLKNLYVSDGSQFSTAMTANPTLTIVALAIRQAEHILDSAR